MIQIEKPKISFKEGADAQNGQFIIEPLERGFGLTLGNSMRRTLLSSLPGAAVSAIRVAGVAHEFSTIKGVKEDVVEIVLNIKNLTLKSATNNAGFKTVLKLKNKGAKTLYAKDIEFNDQVEIINKDQIICTCDDDANLDMDLIVTRGRGYVPSTANKDENEPIGYIAVDSLYSPVIKANYTVESARVGQSIDYDKLTLDVQTNGTYTAKEVVALSAKIILDHINLFVELVEDMSSQQTLVVSKADENRKNLEKPIDDMNLSARSMNCLKRTSIKTLEDLTQKSREDMKKIKNLGEKSIEEIEEKLAGYGLSFRQDDTE